MFGMFEKARIRQAFQIVFFLQKIKRSIRTIFVPSVALIKRKLQFYCFVFQEDAFYIQDRKLLS